MDIADAGAVDSWGCNGMGEVYTVVPPIVLLFAGIVSTPLLAPLLLLSLLSLP
jgi:hypothetical protein